MTREEKGAIIVVIGVIITIVITLIFNLWMLYLTAGIFAVLLAMPYVFLGYDDEEYKDCRGGAIVLAGLFGPVGLFSLCYDFYNLPEKKEYF